jgi:hypothetical protein
MVCAHGATATDQGLAERLVIVGDAWN